MVISCCSVSFPGNLSPAERTGQREAAGVGVWFVQQSFSQGLGEIARQHVHLTASERQQQLVEH